MKRIFELLQLGLGFAVAFMAIELARQEEAHRLFLCALSLYVTLQEVLRPWKDLR